MDTEKYTGQTFYKYSPLNMERFLDIIVKNRLYGATFKELNDPMERKFDHSKLSVEEQKIIFPKFSRYRVCSMLQKREDQDFPNDFLMWSHYADGHKGVCFEVEMVNQHNQDWKLLTVKYSDKLVAPIDASDDSLDEIISTKSTIWENEHEVRAVRLYKDKDKINVLSKYVAVKIRAIYLGNNISAERADIIKRTAYALNENIKVYKMKIDASTDTHLTCTELKRNK